MPSTATKSTRVTYGFKLDFPQKDFTLRDLRNMKGRKVKYITIYMRVKNALKNGEIAVVGKKAPKHTRKGRQELVYSRVNAKTAIVTATPVDAEVVVASDLSS